MDDYFREKEMAYTAQTFSTIAEAVAAYEAGKCDAYTADQSQLYAVRLKLAKPEEHIILPEVISKEPLGRPCASAMSSGSTSRAGHCSR